MLDQHIAQRHPGFVVLWIVRNRIAKKIGGILILATACKGVRGNDIARGQGCGIVEFAPRLDHQLAGSGGLLGTDTGRRRLIGRTLQRIARQTEQQRRAKQRPAAARQTEQGGGGKEPQPRQREDRQPAHARLPKRRQKIAPAPTSSRSGTANSGQVVALTCGS